MKKLLFCLVLVSAPSWATVACSSGTWNGSTTCTGGTHPLTYTITGTSSLSSSEFNAAFADACLGDVIELEENKPMTLSSSGVLKLTKRSCGTGYLTIRSRAISKLPNDGTRITPAYLPLTAIIQKDPTASVANCATAITTPWMFLVGGKKQKMDHLVLEGITFRVSPVADRANPATIVPTGGGCTVAFSSRTMKGSAAYIQTGKDQNGNKDNGTNGPSSYSTGYSETTLSSSTSVGATTIPLTDVTGIEAGMVLAILDTTAGSDWVVVSSVDVGLNQVTSSRAMAFAHASGKEVNQAITDSARDMPDDIIIRHCMGLSDQLLRTPYGFYVDAQAITVKDSFLEGFIASSPADARAILGSNGVGPVTLTNNYLDAAAENVMFGGSTPTGDWEQGKAGDSYVRYNYLPKILERTRQGPWDKVVRDAPVGQYGISRLVFKGRYVMPSSSYPASISTAQMWVAKNTGIAGTTEPSWPASPAINDEITDGGVTWFYAGDSFSAQVPYYKNNFELKLGQNVYLQYNVMDGFPDNQAWNGSQAKIVNLKAQDQGCNNTTLVAWPDCYAARLKNINVLNNKMITQYGGINVGTGLGFYAATNGVQDINIKGNLIIHTELNLSGTSSGNDTNVCLQLGLAKTDDVMTNLQIMNNTCYSAIASSNSANVSFSQSIGATGANYPGDNRLAGNIWPAWAFSYRHPVQGNDGGNVLKVFPCIGLNHTGCTARQFDKNIINGAVTNTTNNYKSGTVLSNCSSTSACSQPTAWDYTSSSGTNGAVTGIAAANRVATFRNRTSDITRGVQGLSLATNHVWKRAIDGADVGADPNYVPDIRNLTVTPTDRTVLFQWSLSPVIENTPCVVEVWSGDYEPPPYSSASYAGELGTISTYYRQDADDADRNVRSGLKRMLTVGHTANLTASTLYGYRLQCGGDAKHGTFTTLATLSSTSTQTIRRVIKHASALSMQVQYGTSYSRSTDAITGSTASTNCTTGNLCTVTFSANKGSVYYVRWLEKSATAGGGSTLISGPVDVISVTQ